MALLERCADDAGELRGEHAVEPTGITGRKAAEQLNTPVEHIEQLVFGEVGENVEQDRIAVLDTTREVEDSDTRDTEGSKQHFTVFVPELIMIAGERQAGADAQAIQRLECRPIADDRCRYGAEGGAQRSEGEAKRIGDTGGVAARGDNYGMCLQGLVLARDIGERLPKRAELRFSVVVLFCLERPRWTVYLECPAFGSFVRRGNVGSAD